ncbi:MAG: Ku protein [Pseudomonadota bacterium]
MPAASTRSTWKGAISFGLVHIPIELRSATVETRPAFKWIDPASKSAVGNQQVSKATGEAIDPASIVKGIEIEDGQFVTLTKEEIRAALPKATQTIDIEAFVDAAQIPPSYFDRPYHVVPVGKGQKAYELLRETLVATGKVGLARVVISTRQHLAALMPMERGMMLNLLRWSEQVRSMEGLELPDESVQVNARELKMARMLVEELAADWEPDLFHDEFKEQLAELIEAKAKAGKTLSIAKPDSDEAQTQTADVLDISELLKRSLDRKARTAATPQAKPDAKPTSKPAEDRKVTPLRRAAAAAKAPARAAAAAKAPTRAAAAAKPAPERKTR